MKFEETKLQGAFVVDLVKIEDERGFFSRSFCANEFDEHGINSTVKQVNMSYNEYEGTLRGLHFQVAPAIETKFVRCTKGSIIDVIVDLREDSETYLQHVSIELTADNRRALFVPANFAHGFQTLEDNTEVLYMVSEFYTPDCERGLRYNDPALSIEWPRPVTHITSKDEQWPLFTQG